MTLSCTEFGLQGKKSGCLVLKVLIADICRYDGQAGAAAITLENQSIASQSELASKLYEELKAKGVPSYAFPRLVRFIEK